MWKIPANVIFYYLNFPAPLTVATLTVSYQIYVRYLPRSRRRFIYPVGHDTQEKVNYSSKNSLAAKYTTVMSNINFITSLFVYQCGKIKAKDHGNIVQNLAGRDKLPWGAIIRYLSNWTGLTAWPYSCILANYSYSVETAIKMMDE